MKPFEKAARAFASSRGSEGTREVYLADLERWLAYCKRTKADPAAPTLELATAFRDELQKTLAPQTVRRILAALSSMYEAELAKEDQIVTWNPFKARALPRPPATAYAKTEMLSDAESEAIIAAAEAVGGDLGIRDVAVLRLVYETGLRIAPVASLRRENVIRRGDKTIIRVFSKGQKWIEKEVPNKAAAALERWLSRAPTGAFVFPATKNEGPITPKAFNGRFKVYGDAAGVAHVHPHRFRASFITSAIDSGIPLVDVQAAADQADPRTTQRYDRGVRGTGVADAVAKFREGKK